VHGQGARLEAMSLQPVFAFFALFAVPFPCFDAVPHAPRPLREKVQAKQRVTGSTSGK